MKPIGSRTAADAPKPSVRAGSLFDSSPEAATGAGAAPAGDTAIAGAKTLIVEPGSVVSQPREHPPKKVSLQAPESRETGYAFATHRPAPASRKAERAELASVTGGKPGREVSAGFVLGVAIIVITLVGGIMVARLGGKVKSLEARLGQLEAAEIEVATAEHRAP